MDGTVDDLLTTEIDLHESWKLRIMWCVCGPWINATAWIEGIKAVRDV